MKTKVLFAIVLLCVLNASAQDVTRIETKEGIRYITTILDYPITGTYYFNGSEPTVELNSGGNGYYQLHEQPARPVVWGIECDAAGEPIFKKGY